MFWFNGEFLCLSFSTKKFTLFTISNSGPACPCISYCWVKVRNRKQGSCLNRGQHISKCSYVDNKDLDIKVKSAKFAGWYGGHCHRPSLYHCYSFGLFCFACFSVFSLPVAGDDIPEEFLENAKRIGKEALKAKETASSR